MVQNTISNASERKLVMNQIRRAKRVIKAFKQCASDYEIDILDTWRGRHLGDTWLLSLQVQRWEELVAAYDKTEDFFRDGMPSLSEVSQLVASFIISRGGYTGVLSDARDGRLSLRRAQEVLEYYGVTVQCNIQLVGPKEENEVSK